MRLTLGAVLAAAVTCLSACDAKDERAPDPSRAQAPSAAAIQTDTSHYTLVREERGWGTSIPFRFTNFAADTAYAVNCNGATTIALEKKDSVGWRVVWAPLINGCLSPPVTITPGDTLEGSVRLWGAPPGGNVGPEFTDTTFHGAYRLVWHNFVFHYTTQGGPFGDTIPLRYRVSNEFTLRTTDQADPSQ